MVTMASWQLALIILGALWIGSLAGFFLAAALSLASDVDDLHPHHWTEEN